MSTTYIVSIHGSASREVATPVYVGNLCEQAVRHGVSIKYRIHDGGTSQGSAKVPRRFREGSAKVLHRAPEREMRSITRPTSLLHMCCIICRLKIRSVGPGSRAREATSACMCRQLGVDSSEGPKNRETV